MFNLRKKRIKIIWALLFIGFVFFSSFLGAAWADEWNIKKSGHFILYYKEAPQEYISEVSRCAENYYRNIADYLGFRRFNFWTWDKRCKIYFYPNKEEYLKETNAVEWSRGRVHVLKKEITTFVKDEQLLDYILPHELGHIVFREAVGFDKDLPLWLDEGVALLQEKDRDKYLAAAKDLVKKGEYKPLEAFFRISDYNGLVPRVFYSQAASVVEFLLEYFGRERFIIFCRNVRDGQEWEQAFKKVYNLYNLSEFERLWLTYMQIKGE